nr:hypothetical protein [Clostridioides sp.]
MHYARYGFKGIKAASATSEQRAINNLKRKLKERYYPGDKFKY